MDPSKHHGTHSQEPEKPSCCHQDDHKQKKPFYRKPLFIWTCLTAAVYAASFFVPALHHFRRSFHEYAVMLALPMLAGLFIGGVIDHYIPQEYISKTLTARKKRTVFAAVGLGFLMSACSHGIIALSMELHKKGASGSSVISFLLASPWANLPITFLLVGFFGAKGFLILGLSLMVAVITGLIFQVLDEKGWIEKNRHTVALEADFSIRADIAKRFKNRKWTAASFAQDAKGVWRGTFELADMILTWVLLGILLASLAGALVPPDLFQKYFGASLLGLLATLLAAAVFEVCSEGTSPLAFEIYKQTGAIGNSFAFLMGGVVTDYTEIGLVWNRLGKRTALWMLGITLPQVFILGWLLNAFVR